MTLEGSTAAAGALVRSTTFADVELAAGDACPLGQHTDHLSSEIGLPMAEISRLRTHGVVW